MTISERDWFAPRNYIHFDKPTPPLRTKEAAQDPCSVVHRAFLPFIHYTIVTPRARKEKKERHIAYASHMDSAIFAWYSRILSEKYEENLSQAGLSDCVLAYRRFIPSKCNIDFAKEVFDQIDERSHNTAICLDIRGFFDNLNHKILKKLWANVLGEDRLPEDHYAVFRAITRYALVDRDPLYKMFGISRQKRKNFRGAICTPQEFREKVRGGKLIKVNPVPFGIPQGSPISAVLSNIYMLDFDLKMKVYCDQKGAVYRRYCDDIIILCSESQMKDIEDYSSESITSLELEINQGKTTGSVFRRTEQGIVADPPLQYLGFIFDGSKRLIRSQTLARYYRRMKRFVKQSGKAARKAATRGGQRKVYRKKIYEKYSHLHRNRNFPGYLYRSAKLMKSEAIRRQFKRHWKTLQHELGRADTDP